jgi:hypothetical protein
MQQLFCPVFSSATLPTKILERIRYFRRLAKPTKLTNLFSSVSKTDETNSIFFVGQLSRRKYVFIFVGLSGRRKSVHFRQSYSIGLFSSADRRIYVFSTVFSYFRRFLADEIKLFFLIVCAWEAPRLLPFLGCG